jgi:hypothetical protein
MLHGLKAVLAAIRDSENTDDGYEAKKLTRPPTSAPHGAAPFTARYYGVRDGGIQSTAVRGG